MQRPAALAVLTVLVGCGLAGCGTTPRSPTLRDSDLRAEFERLGLPPRAQGPRPTCSIFTTVAAFEFATAKVTGAKERLSVEYCNWAANAANGRADDGDFFHFALSGHERFGICRDTLWPYGATFDAHTVPSPDALVDGGRHLAAEAPRLRVRWIKPNDGKQGLSDAQFADVVQTLANGWPIAAGSGHSRVLVGFHADAQAPGGGTFRTLDSALAAFAEVPAAFVKNELYDVFVVEAAAP